MQLRRDHRVVRTLGVLFGIGLLALGLASVLGLAETGHPSATGRSGLGLVLLAAGTATIVASLTIADPTAIF